MEGGESERERWREREYRNSPTEKDGGVHNLSPASSALGLSSGSLADFSP